MLTITGLTIALALSAALLTWLAIETITTIETAIRHRGGVRRHLVNIANARIYRLSRTLRIDLPQFDARTRTQRREDDAFMALGATFHRED